MHFSPSSESHSNRNDRNTVILLAKIEIDWWIQIWTKWIFYGVFFFLPFPVVHPYECNIQIECAHFDTNPHFLKAKWTASLIHSVLCIKNISWNVNKWLFCLALSLTQSQCFFPIYFWAESFEHWMCDWMLKNECNIEIYVNVNQTS